MYNKTPDWQTFAMRTSIYSAVCSLYSVCTTPYLQVCFSLNLWFFVFFFVGLAMVVFSNSFPDRSVYEWFSGSLSFPY